MTFDDIILKIENAHQDALNTFDVLQDLVFSEDDIEITLSDGVTRTVKSYVNLKQEIYKSLSTKDYTILNSDFINNNYDTLNLGSFVKFVSESDGYDTNDGSKTAPYKTIGKAVNSIEGNFGVIFLKAREFSSPYNRESYHLYNNLTGDAKVDVKIDDKIIIFDVYNIEAGGGNFAVGNNELSDPSINIDLKLKENLPIIAPLYVNSESNTNLALGIDPKIVDIYLDLYDTDVIDDISHPPYRNVYPATITDSQIEKQTNAISRPYFYSIVPKNSVLVFNNILFTNVWVETGGSDVEMPSSNPFLSSFDATDVDATEFKIRPMPAIFKDWFRQIEINPETNSVVTGGFDYLTNENYFSNQKNRIHFNGCTFMLHNMCGGLFYFNNIIDNSYQYEIIIENSIIEAFDEHTYNGITAGSDVGLSNNFAKYNPLILLENNRILNSNDSSITNTMYSDEIFDNQFYPYRLIELLQHKYKINMKISNISVNKALLKIDLDTLDVLDWEEDGFLDTESLSIHYLNNPTYTLPQSFNIFRLIETYRYNLDASSVIFPQFLYGNNFLRNGYVPHNSEKMGFYSFDGSDYNEDTTLEVTEGSIAPSTSGQILSNSPVLFENSIALYDNNDSSYTIPSLNIQLERT